MIQGIGLDVVNVERFVNKLTPVLADRLFSAGEKTRPPASLAGVFAAKEAVIKALGGVEGFSWHDITVTRAASGAPVVELTGATGRAAKARGVTRIHVTISHDEPVAAAMVLLEKEDQ